MKNKIKTTIKIILAFLLLLFLLAMGVTAYLFWADIESTPSEEAKKQIEITEKTYQNRKVFFLSPKEQEKTNTVIFYLHGGSYIAETSKEHWSFLADLVEDTKTRVILPDYPLAPKYNYKEVFDMIEPLYEELINTQKAEKIIVMGDSAGGGMALALCEKLGEEGKQKPNQLILLSPWLDVKLENEEISEVEKYDKQLHRGALKIAGIAYAGEDGMQSYLVNPILGDPQTLQDISITVFTGTYDILNPDVHKWITIVGEKTQIELKEYEQAPHIWLLDRSADRTTMAEQAYQELIKTINSI